MTDKSVTFSLPLGEMYHKKTWIEKYGNSMKTMLPIRFSKQRDKSILPNHSVGCCSFMSASWMSKIMWKASRKGCQPDEIGKIAEPDAVNANNERLLRLWNKELTKYGTEKASLHRTVWRFNRFRLILASFMMALTCIFSYIGPAWILQYLLEFLDEPQLPLWYGLLLVLFLSISQLLRNICYSAMWIMGSNAGVKLHGALQVLIYEKVLRIKSGGEKLTAEVVNHCTSDVERVYQSMQMTQMIVGSPVMWALNVGYTYWLMGPWSLLGNAVILLYYPIMILVANLTSQMRLNAIKYTDKRIGLMSQVLSSIKLIKMYAWEDAFSNAIKDIRHNEESVLQKAVFLQSMSWTTAPVISIIAPMATIFGYVLWGENLTSPQAFSLMSVYSALLLPLNTLPMAVKAFSEGLVCCNRIQKMLLASDFIQPCATVTNPDYAITVTDADLAWEGTLEKKSKKTSKPKKRKPDEKVYSSQTALYATSNSNSSLDSIASVQSRLKMISSGINLTVKKGELIGICGNVGSGKSTLLSAISGDATVVKGRVAVQGSIALVSQQAWIFNGTVRENILFGLPYDEQRYKSVVESCSLKSDFTMMPNADETEIGERGANLSGGQKQRISLARALYSNRDIYLLDDTLSAVDVKVSQHIFQNCIRGAMREKTVLLVTHAVHLLEHCDYIYVMDEGNIVEQGTHDTLTALGGEYSQMVLADKDERGENNVKDPMQRKKSAKRPTELDEGVSGEGTTIKAEVDLNKSLTWKTWLYFCKMCGGYIISFLVFSTILLFNLAMMFNTVWLQVWLDAGSGSYNGDTNATVNGSASSAPNSSSTSIVDNITVNPQLHMYLAVYGASAIAIILLGIIKAIAIGKAMLTGASALHHVMFWKVIRSPMSFFDTTPLGRIINRFSKDMDELDAYIPYTMDFVVQQVILILLQFVLIGVLYLWYFLGLIIVFILFVGFDVFLNGGVRETKRIDNLLRPPLLAHIAATIQGLPIIRCYEKQKMFAEKFRCLVDKQLSGFLLFQLSSKWLAFRADTVSWIVITGTTLMVVLQRSSASAAVAGLAMVQIFRICGVVSVIMRWKSELSARLISIERVTDYCKNLTEEAPSLLEDSCPPPEWPSQGYVQFTDVHLRYRPELPLVLHGLTVSIKGGEKVGIIGRTGAGKSSVIGTLLRLSEICQGSIIIDGINISKIGLKNLRSKIAVIPQEPVLFEGTVRWNLDPFQEFHNEEIWEALEKAHLKKKIAKEAEKLETLLNAEGAIFSLGEKQLFCLARALLRNSKVLLLDEATASVDIETDRLIQKTIRSAFSHCTVLTIAHRLNTISDYDKIMAMDAGRVIEFDSPENLMSRDSLFRTMMKSMMECR